MRVPAAEGTADGGEAAADDTDDTGGVWACIMFFFVHFNGFAVQETITTPIVEDWFSWDETGANPSSPPPARPTWSPS